MKLDLHVHSDASYDGILSRTRIKALAKANGLDGVAICDHQISPSVFEKDTDFLWIPGIEYSTQYGHLLGLFLKRPVGLTDTPRTDFYQAAKEIHNAGGLCILAHPYEQMADSQRTGILQSLLPYIDGIEIFNSRAAYKYPDANNLACEFASANKITCRTCGSDAHRPQEIGNAYVEIPEGDPQTAIQTGKVICHGVQSKRIYMAQSQFVKLKRTNAGLKKYCKTFLLFVYFIVKDLLKK